MTLTFLPITTESIKQRLGTLETVAAAQAKKLLGTDRKTVELTFDPTSGLLTKVVEKNGSTVVETTDLSYVNGVLQTVVTTTGSTVITDTLSYTNGKLTGISRGW